MNNGLAGGRYSRSHRIPLLWQGAVQKNQPGAGFAMISLISLDF